MLTARENASRCRLLCGKILQAGRVCGPPFSYSGSVQIVTKDVKKMVAVTIWNVVD